MKHLLALASLGLALSLGTAHAADAKKTPQQEKMAMCNKDAADKKGDERKAFMKTCLSDKKEVVAAAAPTQQTKMKTCNVDAGDKKGDERKAFMKTCLSDKKDAAPVAAAAPTPQQAQQMKMKTCNTDAADKKGDERKKFMSECLKKAA